MRSKEIKLEKDLFKVFLKIEPGREYYLVFNKIKFEHYTGEERLFGFNSFEKLPEYQSGEGRFSVFNLFEKFVKFSEYQAGERKIFVSNIDS